MEWGHVARAVEYLLQDDVCSNESAYMGGKVTHSTGIYNIVARWDKTC